MSRVLKFRAFDKTNNQMFYWELPNFDSKHASHYDNLMQFTGLKDQKGNDIYEGDILELNNCSLLIVRFYKGEFKLQKLAEYHKKRNLYASISYLEFSVLRGNIYENTELLTI